MAMGSAVQVYNNDGDTKPYVRLLEALSNSHNFGRHSLNIFTKKWSGLALLVAGLLMIVIGVGYWIYDTNRRKNFHQNGHNRELPAVVRPSSADQFQSPSIQTTATESSATQRRHAPALSQTPVSPVQNFSLSTHYQKPLIRAEPPPAYESVAGQNVRLRSEPTPQPHHTQTQVQAQRTSYAAAMHGQSVLSTTAV